MRAKPEEVEERNFVFECIIILSDNLMGHDSFMVTFLLFDAGFNSFRAVPTWVVPCLILRKVLLLSPFRRDFR